jgi:hypothetical protein
LLYPKVAKVPFPMVTNDVEALEAHIHVDKGACAQVVTSSLAHRLLQVIRIQKEAARVLTCERAALSKFSLVSHDTIPRLHE